MKCAASQQHAIGGDSIGQGTGMKFVANDIPHSFHLHGPHQRLLVNHDAARLLTAISLGPSAVDSFSTFYFLEED